MHVLVFNVYKNCKKIIKKNKISIESKISEAWIKKGISHKYFMTTINEERNYGELKESTRMMKSKKSGKKVNLVKKDKK